ncbi:MAG: type II secretion system F family protein [Puniceicoccales bacterium]|jgi:type II secretory pathway component PulF|nr:type II secretion system F family protein [Puniceicoccales bacterium]
MALFSYSALDASGQARNGKINAEDRRSAARRLAAQGLRVLNLGGGDTAAGDGSDAKKSAGDDADPHFGGTGGNGGNGGTGAGGASGSMLDGPMPKKLSSPRLFGPHRTGWAFIDSFHQLHSNGLSMGDSVKLLGQRVSDPALRYLCQSLWRDMSEGATLAGAMSRFPVVFDSATLHLVEAAEATGNLVPVLKKVLASLELREGLRGKILSSVSYPAGICALALGVLCLFVLVLMPRLEKMMKALKGEYPWPVKALTALSDFLVRGGPFLLIALLIGLWAFLRWRKTERGRLTSDGWALRIPVLGPVVTHINTVRMTELLATLMGSGINATDALRLSERPVENLVLRARLNAGRQMINDGAAFASAFKRHALLPLNDLDILSVGENTGSLADTFAAISRRHVAALDKAVSRLIKVVTAVVFGGTVILVLMCVLSIVMTILSVSQSIGQR